MKCVTLTNFINCYIFLCVYLQNTGSNSPAAVRREERGTAKQQSAFIQPCHVWFSNLLHGLQEEG